MIAYLTWKSARLQSLLQLMSYVLGVDIDEAKVDWLW